MHVVGAASAFQLTPRLSFAGRQPSGAPAGDMWELSMIMSKDDGARARRGSLWGARALVAGCLATVLAMATLSVVAPSQAEAAYAPDTWNGYGEFGYVGKSKAQRKSAFSRGIRKHVVRSERKSRKTVSRKAGKRYAALGTSATDTVSPSAKPSLGSGGGIRWVASSGCLNGSLRAVVAQVAANYGSVTVNSTCRNRGHNARVGGARKSHHLTGNAVDFRVRGNVRGAYAFLRSSGSVGGLKHYGGGLFHIDSGPRRSW